MRQEYQNDCPQYLSEYLSYVRTIKNHTERTQEAYYIDLRVFLRYLKIKHHIADETDFDSIKIADVPFSYIQEFTLNDAYAYMNYLSDVRKNKEASRARKTSSLRKFFDYMHYKSCILADNPLEKLEHPKMKKTLPKYLELDQSTKLLESIDSKHQVRDYCIITLFLNCGMRLSELAGLNISDFSKSERSLRLFGKGQKERIVYLNDACVSALTEYLKIRPDAGKNVKAIFLSHYAGQYSRMSTRRIQKIVEEQLKIAGLGNLGISVHKLRHTAATLMYEYGNVDILVLKDILGHVNLGTTEIYTHLSNKDKMEAAERSPLANVRNVRSTLKSPKLDDNNTDLPDSDLSPAPRSNKKAKQ